MEALAEQIGHTDKHTVHSYMPEYEKIFANRTDVLSVLEIGVLEGGSIKLWHSVFNNATIYGLDTDLSRNQFPDLGPNVVLQQADAYDWQVCNALPQFDIVIDDGPHTLHSQKQCLQMYLPKLKSDGVLIIEDVVSPSWIKDLTSMVPVGMRKHISVKDLRNVKGRHDDIMFIVDLRN